jgi:ABC-type branched-subunit amino acid transport system substrate-binding protein
MNASKARGKRQGAGLRFLARCLLPLILCVVPLAACASTQPVVKIGLVAPFEGRYRSIGYEAIYAARLAVREINAKGGVRGYRIELVALDDRGDPAQAIESARKLMIDPQVMAVIGHYRPDSTDAAIEDYCDGHMPLMAIESVASLPPACLQPPNGFVLGHASRDQWPDDRITFVGSVPDPNSLLAARTFVANYNAIPIDGTRAGPIALQTYDAMALLIDAISRAGKIDRVEVAMAIANGNFSGLGGHYAFDQYGNLIDARSYVYEYDKNGQPVLIK